MMNLYKLPVFVAVSMVGLFLGSCSDSTELSFGEPEVITSGFQFTEGPYWHPDGFLIFSDIPANIIYQWRPGNPESGIFIEPSGNSNGITAMPDGTIVLAQHAGQVSRVTDDLEFEPIVEEYEGNRLNSPNDLTVRSDGLIYFTDPDFGVSSEDKELDFNGVYRINHDGSLTLLYDGFALPNGIVFSPGEEYLYINDSESGEILRFDVTENGDIENPVPFAEVGQMSDMGGADGMITDPAGRLYTTGPNGLMVFDRDGEQIHHIDFDTQITNLTLGGEDGHQLFITSPGDVYRLQIGPGSF